MKTSATGITALLAASAMVVTYDGRFESIEQVFARTCSY